MALGPWKYFEKVGAEVCIFDSCVISHSVLGLLTSVVCISLISDDKIVVSSVLDVVRLIPGVVFRRGQGI